MKRTITTIAVVAAVLAAAPRQADAQATITATATIGANLNVFAGNDLDFQTVIPGFTKTVAVNDGTAGTFSLSGVAGAEVDLTFTSLPGTLAGPGLPLPITYTGVHNTTGDPVAGATAFTPSAGATTNLSGIGELYVYLGGTVDATNLGIIPGTYTAFVTLDAAYTGI